PVVIGGCRLRGALPQIAASKGQFFRVTITEFCPFDAVIRVNAICDRRIHDETSGEVRPLEPCPVSCAVSS
ncbi:hypothetical protein, partial [Bifidobacterium crudilactis]|uniref:hypothetical protein n=1 Tax=Bifidobacterium crudilactis TaxID=327277 RepID=UPI002355BF19